MRIRVVAIRCSAALALFSSPVLGQEQFRLWLSPDFGEQKVSADSIFRSYFQGDVSDQRADFQLAWHDFSLLLPLAQNETEEWLLSAGITALDIETRSRLPDTWERFPTSLWDLRLGATYRRKLEGGGVAGGNLTIGSASDRPFASGAEVTADATAFWTIPQAEGQMWVLYANYANNRGFARHVPVPGAGYLIAADAENLALIGVPLTAISYQPIESVVCEAYYLLPQTVHGKVRCRLSEQLQLHIAFDWSRHRFLRHDREDHDDGLYYNEKLALLGLCWEPAENVRLDFSAGYAFDRLFFEGEDYADRGDNRVDLSDGPIAQVRVAIAL
jgi:hypothetical protein